MADVSRSDLTRPGERAGGPPESRIEQLLLAGLDHYFGGEYERAISVWTRVLFLDRAHPRARAYIDRARSAIAERQRESEELMHRGALAFGRGDAEQARELLTTALERGGPHDVAFALLERLDRLQPAPGSAAADSSPAVRHAPRHAAEAVRVSRGGGRWRAAFVAAFLLCAAAVAATIWGRAPGSLLTGSWPGATKPSAGSALIAVVPVPTPGDVALTRARSLMEAGHLRDALRMLETMDPADRLRPDGDRLKAEIQRALLDSVGGSSAPNGPVRR